MQQINEIDRSSQNLAKKQDGFENKFFEKTCVKKNLTGMCE